MDSLFLFADRESKEYPGLDRIDEEEKKLSQALEDYKEGDQIDLIIVDVNDEIPVRFEEHEKFRREVLGI